MRTQLTTELYCIHCAKETGHVVSYLGKHLEDIKCEECGIHLAIDKVKIMEYFAEDVIERIIAKPRSLTDEFKKDLTKVLKSIPVRVIKKPYKVAKEIIEVIEDSLRK